MIDAVFICPHCDGDFHDFDEFFYHVTYCEDDEGEDAE